MRLFTASATWSLFRDVAVAVQEGTIIAASFIADWGNEPLSFLFSAGMAVFNLCVLFYNLFGKPRKYPSARRGAAREEKTVTEKESDPLLPPREDGDMPEEKSAGDAEGAA